MIRYNTNWMGPINTEWIKKNGDDWSGGRIDVWGTDEPYGVEIGIPIMKSEDWHRFGNWLWNFETDTVWTLDELVKEYEKNHYNITWWKNE
jgi:hypothetical protein